MSCPNASLGGDEWGQSYYSFELLRCGGKTADIQSSMTFGVCYFFFTFFNSWARDLWFDKCLKLFFFSNGDNLNTPHRQTGLFLSLCFFLFICFFLSCCVFNFGFSIILLAGIFPIYRHYGRHDFLPVEIYCTYMCFNAIQPPFFKKVTHDVTTKFVL